LPHRKVKEEGRPKRKRNETPLEARIKKGKRSALQSGFAPDKESKRAARTLITRKEKKPLP
jgi:hypothetical protein